MDHAHLSKSEPAKISIDNLGGVRSSKEPKEQMRSDWRCKYSYPMFLQEGLVLSACPCLKSEPTIEFIEFELVGLVGWACSVHREFEM